MWTGKLGRTERCFALAASNLYSVDTDSGEATPICTVDSVDTEAEFFYYRGSLYLVDGVKLYCIGDDGASIPFGYVPLIGKDWSDNELGKINEPRNLLNSCGRISYRISEKATSILRLDAPVSSVDALYINGESVPASRYTVSSSPPAINVSGLKAFDSVEVYFTYAQTPYTTYALFKNTRALVFGGINNSRPFLWGGEDGAVMFSSAYVSTDNLQKSRLIHPESDALYFPVDYEFTVGDGRYPISTVSRHYDRLLIFTEGGAWMADSSACGTEEFPVMNINSSVGVASRTSATLGNQPCTVGSGSIYLWRSETDELDECNAYSISDGISSALSKDFFKNACVFADNARGELLFSYPNGTGRMWVYNASSRGWACFEGIGAQKFFYFGGNVGFTRDGCMYVFDTSLYRDHGNAEISATFTSGLLDFGTDEKKHMSGLGICFDGESADVSLFLDSDTERPLNVSLEKPDGHGYVSKRISSRRFTHLSFKLSATTQSRQTIHSIYLKRR